MRASPFYALGFCLAVAYGAPIRQRQLTETQLDQFELFAQYASAAYCYSNVHDTGATINCSKGGGICPLVEAAGVSILKAFNEIGDSKTAGYVAVDDTNGLIVVAIQGTAVSSNPIDLATDIDIIRSKTTLCGTANANDGCEIHGGFYGAMQDVQDIITSTVALAKAAQPTYQIITTGHSLGAAVAALLGVYLRKQGNLVDIYTYGQPHLGTVDISNYIQNQAPGSGSNYRITHYNDVVPQLPEHSIGDWDHYYPEFWIDIGDGTVSTTDIKVVTGSLFETSGNEGQRSGLTWIGDTVEGLPSHRQYFGRISNCTSTAPGP